MNRDTLTGIIGAAVLIAAMVGVFFYESNRAATLIGTDAYDVTWETHAMNGPGAQDTTPFQDATEATLDVMEKNLTEVAFTLAWSADQGSSTLKVTVTPPEGSGLEASENPVEGSDGELTITFPVPNDVPEDTVQTGNGEADAKERLAQDNTATLGTGAWTVTVEYTDREGPGGLPAGGDDAAQWSLTTELTHYKAVLTER